jgi:hypothetical protein
VGLAREGAQRFTRLCRRVLITAPSVKLIIHKYIKFNYCPALESQIESQLLDAYTLKHSELELEENMPKAMKLNFSLLELAPVQDKSFISLKSSIYSN